MAQQCPLWPIFANPTIRLRPERFYVACPAVVADKPRPHFEQWFNEVAGDVALF